MAATTRSPRYLDVADALQGEISVLAPNSLLPTEEQLARRFGVSRVTVRGALDLLEKSGLVSRLRGRGTTVSPPKITRRFAPLYSFERDLAEQGVAFETRVLSFDVAALAPDFVRERLRLAAAATVGSLSLVRVVDDRIVCHERRFYPPEISEQFDPKLVESVDASRMLAGVVGSPVVEVDWESEIISTSGDVAAALGVASRTLVLANTYTWNIDGGVPVEAGVISYRIDRCKFKYGAVFGRQSGA